MNKHVTSMILASNSPRRKQLLALGEWLFETIPADVDESPLKDEPPLTYVSRLAQAKARAVADQNPASIIIAADTIVADGDALLGKPQSPQEAMEMLQSLRGRTHQVYTGVAVFNPVTAAMSSEVCKTDVPMRKYSNNEINAYIETGDPFDKAGSYAIQHPEFRPVDELEGCYANVVGLPLCHLIRILAKQGIHGQVNIPTACQKTLDFNCSIHEQVLKGDL